MSDIDQLADIQETTKKGFDLMARLKNRGLRKATITLYLDEEKGVELGWAYDVMDRTQTMFLRREREGIVGELDALQSEWTAKQEEMKAADEAATATATKTARTKNDQAAIEKDYLGRIAELEAKRDALVAEMNGTSLVVNLRAVPPVIQKNTHRLAKEKLGITEKGVPEDREEELSICQFAFLMTVMVQSVTDMESGAVNTEMTYEDAMALIDFLPPGQFQRLNETVGRVQFTDAISRSIEGQEDFS